MVKKHKNNRVVIVGAGNVGTHLARALFAADFEIVSVWSNTTKNAEKLAKEFASSVTTELKNIPQDVDLIAICVADQFIEEIIESLPNLNSALYFHTSGSASLSKLEKFGNRCVFYPLQTFRKNIKVSWDGIPVLLEANSTENLHKIKSIAEKLECKLVLADSVQRLNYHFAAVLSSNFSNYLLLLSENHLVNSKLDIANLQPLMQKMVKNAFKYGPKNSQTGPAIRNDLPTIARHLELVETEETKKVYEMMTQFIMNEFHS